MLHLFKLALKRVACSHTVYSHEGTTVHFYFTERHRQGNLEAPFNVAPFYPFYFLFFPENI
jgi:hypothetical protein